MSNGFDPALIGDSVYEGTDEPLGPFVMTPELAETLNRWNAMVGPVRTLDQMMAEPCPGCGFSGWHCLCGMSNEECGSREHLRAARVALEAEGEVSK